MVGTELFPFFFLIRELKLSRVRPPVERFTEGMPFIRRYLKGVSSGVFRECVDLAQVLLLFVFPAFFDGFGPLVPQHEQGKIRIRGTFLNLPLFTGHAGCRCEECRHFCRVTVVYLEIQVFPEVVSHDRSFGSFSPEVSAAHRGFHHYWKVVAAPGVLIGPPYYLLGFAWVCRGYAYDGAGLTSVPVLRRFCEIFHDSQATVYHRFVKVSRSAGVAECPQVFQVYFQVASENDIVFCILFR